MDATLWQLIMDWLSGITVLTLSPEKLAVWIAAITGFVGAVQGIKKILENLAKWEWLLKLVPPLAKVFAWLAHGIGPVILNAMLTGGTMLLAAISDGTLTGGEALNILLAVFGADLIYRALRAWVFPKTD